MKNPASPSPSRHERNPATSTLLPPGHIASAALAAGRTTLHPLGWWGLAAMVVGSLLPDLLDKTLKVLQVYPWGRTVGHSAVVWAAVPAAAMLALSFWALARPQARAGRLPVPLAVLVGVCLGGGLHMVGDLLADVERGWMFSGVTVSWWFGWPWMNPDQVIFACGDAQELPRLPSLLEVLVVAWTALRVLRQWRLTSSPPSLS